VVGPFGFELGILNFVWILVFGFWICGKEQSPMSPCSRPSPDLTTIYNLLHAAFGPQHWWPAATPFEVMTGAILTQNAAWPNVERAIANLKRARKLTPKAILALSDRELQRLIKPSGFFRVKAKRLRSFVDYFTTRYQGSIARMQREPLARLRPELLRVHGIGPETADSILLYALNQPSFVIDAYTRRILERHGLTTRKARYDDVRAVFENRLPHRVRLFNEYHALFVRLAKTHCRPKPRCAGCPLSAYRQDGAHPPIPLIRKLTAEGAENAEAKELRLSAQGRRLSNSRAWPLDH